MTYQLAEDVDEVGSVLSLFHVVVVVRALDLLYHRSQQTENTQLQRQ